MKKLSYLFVLSLFLVGFAADYVQAQNEPVLYLCVEYGKNGEESVSDVFTTGYLTAVVKCDYALRVKSAAIQFDKYDVDDEKWVFYKKFYYTLNPKDKYVYFSRNDESDMSFDETGFFRVYLLDEDDDSKVIASAIVKIIEKN